jgi:hypothetical protein
MIHLMQAIHAARAGDANGCNATGTKRVELDESKVTCRRCKKWYWHHEGIIVAPHVLKELA